MTSGAYREAEVEAFWHDDIASPSSFARGAEWGAMWLAALIGMGQAIRDRRFCYRCDAALDVYERSRGYGYCLDC